MMLLQSLFSVSLILTLTLSLSHVGNTQHSADTTTATLRLAFGSCGDQNKDQPVLNMAAAMSPDYFLFLGDNIYGDTKDTAVLRAKYTQLGQKPEFRQLMASTRVIATWDDHDYGWNDSGRHYPQKAFSKELFLSFFREPTDSPRRQREGIYTSYYHTKGDKIIQIILLDTRTFRDNLLSYNGEQKGNDAFFYTLDYSPFTSGDSTLLGEAQWSWLEKELTRKADIRIIGTSTQFGISYNGYEAWANVPHERTRFTDLIKRTRAEGILFLSGDVHYSEISRFKTEGLYPLYDFTSSGITSTWYFATPNDNRIEGPVMDNHIGLLTLTLSAATPTIKMECIDVTGNVRFEYTLPLSDLTFPR